MAARKKKKSHIPSDLSFDELAMYNGADCRVTAVAWDEMQADLEPERHVYEHDKELATICQEMQITGIRMDVGHREYLQKRMKRRAAALKGAMRTLVKNEDFDPMKLDMVRHALFVRFRAPMLNPTASGLASTSSLTLEALRISDTRAGRLADLILKWRGVVKVCGTYLDAIQLIDGRFHPNWKPFGTVCMPAGELVLTDRGYLDVKDVREGDQVISHTGTARRVTHTIRCEPAPIYRVTLSNGLKLRTTADHRYLVRGEWVRAADLQVGTQVYVHSDPEEWRHVDGWPYEISSWGRVRPCGRVTPMSLTRIEPYGHLKIRFLKEGHKREFRVHQLVLAAFRGVAEGEVRHLNGIAWDNTIDNLVWGSALENRLDSRAHGTASKRKGVQVKLTETGAARIRAESKGHRDDLRLASELGVSRELVRDVRRGLRWVPETHVIGKRATFKKATVVAIELQAPEVTYGLEVDVDHSHVTGGVVTHNSGRLSCRLQSVPRLELCDSAQALMRRGMRFPEVVERLGDGIYDLESRIREVYIPEKGYQFVYFDLSQAEMRFAANLSGDENFIKTCLGDVHSGNAKVLFPDKAPILDADPKGAGKPFRDVAKNAGFGVTYLAEAETVFKFLRSKGFNGVQLNDVIAMLERMRAGYPDYFKFVENNVNFCRKHGYLRTAILGRIRWFGWYPKPTEIANYPIQSGIADLMNTRIIAMRPKLPRHCRLVAQIHDACVFEVKEGRSARQLVELIKETWEAPAVLPSNGRSFKIPIDLKEGGRWSDFETEKPYKELLENMRKVA